MAIDLFKIVAGIPSAVFTPAKASAKEPTAIERLSQMTAGVAPAASSVYKWPGQKSPYGTPAAPGVPGAVSKPPAASAGPAERAYVEEKNRVAQLAAQNPELQRYEVARKIAAGKSATPEQVQSAEDIGMQIWAQKYGKTLAPKVKPGQAGYDVIQGVLNAGTMGAPMDLPFNPASLLGTNAAQTIPSYAGASDLQPVGTPLLQTQFNTPQNQLQAQMFNRFLSEQATPPVVAPPTNPVEATYAGATNLQPVGDISLEPFSFKTPAESRRAQLFESLLSQANRR